MNKPERLDSANNSYVLYPSKNRIHVHRLSPFAALLFRKMHSPVSMRQLVAVVGEMIERPDTRNQAALEEKIVQQLRHALDAGFIEVISKERTRIEQVLLDDPSGHYEKMDPETREAYHRRLAELARYSTAVDSEEVAKRALREAAAARLARPTEEAATHIGYYIVGPGTGILEKELDYRPPLLQKLRRLNRAHPVLSFSVCVALFSAVLMTLALGYAINHGATRVSLLLIAVMSIFLFMDAAIGMTNYLLKVCSLPSRLPRLTLSEGIPAAHRTLVVIPTLLTSIKNGVEQVVRLEEIVRSNPERNLRFALLSDFGDSSRRTEPEDTNILEAVSKAIVGLNEKYADGWGDKTFLLHRERRWNPSENKWMGWERKRGKLEELTNLLRDPNSETSYEVIVGNFRHVTANASIKYVITLDEDTRLKGDTLTGLVCIAAHPLNQPYYDSALGRVTEGYGIIQPSVAQVLDSNNSTFYAKMVSTIYSIRRRPLYQDVYGEEKYHGKGLFVVDAFRASLKNRIQENTVLSHDSLEGFFARVGQADDLWIEECCATRYSVHSNRLHRWMRGDWQNIPWLFSHLQDRQGRMTRNPLSGLSRLRIWQILFPYVLLPIMLLFLLFAWTLLPGSSLVWTVVGLGLTWPLTQRVFFISRVLFRAAKVLSGTIFRKRSVPSLVPEYVNLMKYTAISMASFGLWVFYKTTTLVHLGYVQLDAATRAFWRMFVSRRNLLEWRSSRQVETSLPRSFYVYLHLFSGSSMWSILVLWVVAMVNQRALPTVIPIAGLWLVAPFIIWYLDRPCREGGGNRIVK